MPLCCVPYCTNRGGHLVPIKNKELLKKWMIAIRRAKFTPNRSTIVCRNHFTSDDYLSKTAYGDSHVHRFLKKDAVPSLFRWTNVCKPADINRSVRANKRAGMKLCEPDVEHIALSVDCHAEEKSSDSSTICTSEACTQTDNVQQVKVDKSTQYSMRKKIFSIEDFIGDDEAFHYYTGLENYSIFKLLLDILGPAVNSLNYFNGPKPNLSSENILFLVLIRLRRYKTIFELGLLFAVDKSQVTNCFVTWVNLMYYTFKELNWWPEKELVRFYMPSDFKSKFPSTRVILDGTECPIQKPSQPLAQQTTFSSYKNRNTLKTVIGFTPGGLVTYVSPCYGGATSDRQIIERGKLPQMCDSGDSVMVDKGFNVDDLFVPNKVSVNTPAFFKK